MLNKGVLTVRSLFLDLNTSYSNTIFLVIQTMTAKSYFHKIKSKLVQLSFKMWILKLDTDRITRTTSFYNLMSQFSVTNTI